MASLNLAQWIAEPKEVFPDLLSVPVEKMRLETRTMAECEFLRAVLEGGFKPSAQEIASVLEQEGNLVDDLEAALRLDDAVDKGYGADSTDVSVLAPTAAVPSTREPDGSLCTDVCCVA